MRHSFNSRPSLCKTQWQKGFLYTSRNHKSSSSQMPPSPVGGPSGTPSTVRSLGPNPSGPPYQHPGAQCNPVGGSTLGTSVVQSHNQGLLRQQHSSRLHQERRGGTRSRALFEITVIYIYILYIYILFEILDELKVCLIPTHLPRACKVTADALSRLNRPSPTEWRLGKENLNRLFSVFGTPLIDMFATDMNKVVPTFVSPYPDESAWAVDALSISWDDLGLVYAFPPPPIMNKTILEIEQSRGTQVILIASQIPTKSWFPALLELSIRPRLQLRDLKLYQFLPHHRKPTYHQHSELLDLAAWMLLGRPSETRTSLSP